MSEGSSNFLSYQRARFTTRLPVDALYSPSHAWIARVDPEHWRVGLTKFATRMLGELVDHAFDVQPGDAVEPGQILGWIEGFKAISDVYCIARGRFVGSNPLLKERLGVVHSDPYGEGWLYVVRGNPDAGCLDVDGYARLLDKTIDKILEREDVGGAADSSRAGT